MSFTIDASLLLYAINKDSPFHPAAKAFIESCAEKDQLWYISWPVIHTFIRISTHARILPAPLSPREAVAIIEQIVNLPNVHTIGETEPGFWDIYKQEIESAHQRGNQIPDTIIVSIMKAHGVRTIYTKDRDFLRFKGIKAIDPISSI